MLISEESQITNVKVPNLIKLYTLMKKFNAHLAFQVYLDLCLFRGWKKVRIIYNQFIRLYLIIAFNPKKKKINSLELFIPFSSNARLTPNISEKISSILLKYNLHEVCKTVNFAFVDQDSTVAYYCLISNFHKITGPFI